MHVGFDQPLARFATGLLFGHGKTALFDQLLGLAHVAQGILDRLLAFHDARAGLVAELLDEFS